MKHLGRSPHWVNISNRVIFPPEIIAQYEEIKKNSIGNFEKDFSKRLFEGNINPTPMVVQPRGLENYGLMCFSNSSIQLLFASPPFVSFVYFMKTNLPLFTPNQRKITPTWRSLCTFLNEFKFSDCATTDGNFSSLKSLDLISSTFPTNTNILNESFGPFSSKRKPCLQEDATEFLTYFLNLLHDELLNLIKLNPLCKIDNETPWKTQGSNRGLIEVSETQGDKSPLSSIFSILVHSDTLSFHKSRSMNKESHLVLPLAITNIFNLNLAINKFLEEEQITDEISKKYSILNLPESIIFGLKRFGFNEYGPSKLTHIVEYPEILEMNTINGMKNQYQLSAIVVHIGQSPSSGHYICYSRRFDGTWLKFDDDKVINLDGNEAILGLQAYLLLYNKITSTRK